MKIHSIRRARYVVIVVLVLLIAIPTWGQQKYEVRDKTVTNHMYFDILGIGSDSSFNKVSEEKSEYFDVFQFGFPWPKPFGIEVSLLDGGRSIISFFPLGIFLPIKTVNWPFKHDFGTILNLTARAHLLNSYGSSDENFPPFFDIVLEWRSFLHTISVGYRHQTKPYYDDRILRRLDTSGVFVIVRANLGVAGVESYTKTIKKRLPNPQLTLSASLNEPSGNRVIESGEKGRIHITLKNKGKGKAEEVRLKISADNSLVFQEPEQAVGLLDSGQGTTVSFPVTASQVERNRNTIVHIECLEKDGFNVEGSLEIPVAPYKPRPLYPPRLIVSEPKFHEPSGNNMLDAEEQGYVEFDVTNQGRGGAYDVEYTIQSKSSHPAIKYNQKGEIGDLAPGYSKHMRIVVSALGDVPSSKIQWEIHFNERYKQPPDPIYVSFQTQVYRPPALIVVDHKVEDSDNDGKVSRGEVANIILRIYNEGEGEARAVTADIQLGEYTYLAGKSKSFHNLGDLKVKAYKDVNFEIYTDRAIRADKITLTVTLAEAKGKYGSKQPIAIPLDLPVPRSFTFEPKPERPDRPSIEGLSIDIDVNIPSTSISKPDGIAVVIGNRDYRNPGVPPVDYALRDATVMKDYLIKTFGFKEGNILFYENATQGDLNSLFGTEKEYKGMLYDLVKRGKSDVFIYYSGHGAPDLQSKEGYFVPVDCDPRRVKLNGYSLNLFYQNVSKIPTKSFIIIIDACFSGISQGGSLLGAISPIYPTVENPLLFLPNATVIAAARGDEVSGWYPQKKHGLLTYFFLKGISGDADIDKNKEVTLKELKKFLSDETEGVSYWARILHSKEQHPDMFGLEDTIIVKY